MILTDASSLVALLDKKDRDHDACVRQAALLSVPMLTTWPAFTEAMYLLGNAEPPWKGQAILWDLVTRGDLEIAQASYQETRRMATLMKQYRDVPMDLADASLVALAEARSLSRIFTLDRHFKAYRLSNRKALEVVP